MILAVLPLLVPLATALLCAALQGMPRLQRGASIAGAILLLFCAVALVRQVVLHGVLTLAAGNWPLPFGTRSGRRHDAHRDPGVAVQRCG